MKKALLAIVAGILATSIQAAQINWGATGQIKFDNVNVGNGGSTLQLVALYDITDTLTDYAAKVANGTDTTHVVAEKATNAGSAALPATNPYGFTFADENSMTGKTYKDGAAFAFIALTKDKNGKDMYWASDVFNVSETNPVNCTYNGTSKAFTASVNALNTINTHWAPVPVPEPSVALMGLLGLGMMLKRRRA